MIPDSYKNKVYFSDLLPQRCPKTYRGLINVLNKYGVPHELIEGTKDIWCRDYMPVQIMGNMFSLFRYEPDYLLDTEEHKALITDNTFSSRYIGTSHLLDCCYIKIDGGNVVQNFGKVIMTAKVFEENPHFTSLDLLNRFTHIFGAEIIILPWDTNEIYGHVDGIVRIIDDNTVLMTNYDQFDPDMAARFRNILSHHFKNVKELKFKAKKPYKYSWAYINWLQTKDVLILPKFGVPEDNQALKQITRLMPNYKDCIEMIDATDLIKHEGCLNCASWTLYDTPNRDVL